MLVIVETRDAAEERVADDQQGTDGIQATRQLTADDDGPRVLILTTVDLDEYVYDALRAGASGFLLEDVTAERLFDAARVIAAARRCSPR